MVTGGDVLVEVRSSGGASIGGAALKLNGQPVPEALRNPAQLVLVRGLSLGANILEVTAGNKTLAKLVVKNHPIEGPVISGPHQTPFICQTETFGLGTARDANCGAERKVQYFYWSTESRFKPLESETAHPPDLARTSVNGAMMDFIVRKETGVVNRAIYEIAFLHQPGSPLPDPWTESTAWNRRLVYAFGGGCSAGFRQGPATAGVMRADFLGKGYAIVSSTQNVFGNNCNDVLSAETLMMMKELFIERFGPPVYTIGWGTSGGSMQQHLIAQNYPGLLDGIVPGVIYPDLMTVMPGALDCALLANVFERSTLSWTEEQKGAVSGFSTWGMCVLRERGKLTWIPSGFSPGWLNPTRCDPAVPKDRIYDPVSNPAGIRCTVYDNVVNLVGKDPRNGAARRLLDNSGVQYGLNAFNAGKITAEQFVELNDRIGGFDNDGRATGERMEADPQAIRAAYRNGRVNTGAGGLSSIPIIEIRPYLDSLPDLHDRFRSYSIRARLKAANGHAHNHVMFVFPTAGALAYDFINPKSPFNIHGLEALELMDRWLDNIARDASSDPRAQKVVRNKPAGLADTCWSPSGEKISGDRERCDKLFPIYGDPRTAAGAPIANDVLKCSLKPVRLADYNQALSAEQLARLNKTFPKGVCDYRQPGIGQQFVADTWRIY